jgi:osmoprotectant transport system ATP-binding protein
VARFVGADRGLKRLSLTRVGGLDLRPPVMAKAGDDAAEARRRVTADPFPYLLLVDDAHRPIGWVRGQDIPASGVLREVHADGTSPLLDKRATLKDALSLLLDADVQAGIVVDRQQTVVGLVTADIIAEQMRDGPHVVPDKPYPPEDPEPDSDRPEPES